MTTYLNEVHTTTKISSSPFFYANVHLRANFFQVQFTFRCNLLVHDTHSLQSDLLPPETNHLLCLVVDAWWLVWKISRRKQDSYFYTHTTASPHILAHYCTQINNSTIHVLVEFQIQRPKQSEYYFFSGKTRSQFPFELRVAIARQVSNYNSVSKLKRINFFCGSCVMGLDKECKTVIEHRLLYAI